MLRSLLSCLLLIGIYGSTSLNRRLYSKMYGMSYNRTIDYTKAKQLRLESYVSSSINHDWVKTIKDKPSSRECKSTFHQLHRIRDSFDTLVEFPMSEIDMYGQECLSAMGDVQQLQDDLTNLHTVLGLLKTTVSWLTVMPVVGVAMSTFKYGISSFREGIVTNLKDSVQSFNTNIIDKVKPLTEKVVEQNADLAEKIHVLKFIVYEKVMKPLLVVDEYCPNVTKDSLCSVDVTNELGRIADQLENYVMKVQYIANFYSELYDVLNGIGIFQNNLVYQETIMFFGKITYAINPFTSFLDKQISLKLSVGKTCLKVPCGTKFCKKKIFGRNVRYTCGVNMCDRCTPNAKINYKFKVKSIINGVGTLTSIFMDTLKSMMPPLPTLDIPGFPDLPDLSLSMDIPELDMNIDLFNLGFTCMNTDYGIHNGLPVGLDISNCFSGVPSMSCI